MTHIWLSDSMERNHERYSGVWLNTGSISLGGVILFRIIDSKRVGSLFLPPLGLDRNCSSTSSKSPYRPQPKHLKSIMNITKQTDLNEHNVHSSIHSTYRSINMAAWLFMFISHMLEGKFHTTTRYATWEWFRSHVHGFDVLSKVWPLYFQATNKG